MSRPSLPTTCYCCCSERGPALRLCKCDDVWHPDEYRRIEVCDFCNNLRRVFSDYVHGTIYRSRTWYNHHDSVDETAFYPNILCTGSANHGMMDIAPMEIIMKKKKKTLSELTSTMYQT